MKKNIHWLVIAAYTYVVFFLTVQILAFIYTTYQANQIKKAYYEYEAQEAHQLKEDSVDEYFEIIKPIIDAGETSKTAIPILVLNIKVSVFTTLFLILPNFVKDKITDYVYKCGGNIDIDAFSKFSRIILIINILIAFFDFYETKTYWDFANAFIK